MSRTKGFLAGTITAAAFGLIPLFTLPVMAEGLGVLSILFYRFSFAAVAIACMMLAKGESFRIAWPEMRVIILLGIFFNSASLFLFWSYQYMGPGLATTLHFTYPLFVTFFLFTFFGERPSWVVWLAIVLAVVGVGVLSVRGGELTMSLEGLVIAVLSAVGYGGYITGVNKTRAVAMPGRKLALYVFIVAASLFALTAQFFGGVQGIPSFSSFGYLVGLAVVPTLISNITLIVAVQNIGGMLTSVLGAMEPVTALLVGFAFFGESFSGQELVGILLVLLAVTMVILTRALERGVRGIFRWMRPRHA